LRQGWTIDELESVRHEGSKERIALDAGGEGGGCRNEPLRGFWVAVQDPRERAYIVSRHDMPRTVMLHLIDDPDTDVPVHRRNDVPAIVAAAWGQDDLVASSIVVGGNQFLHIPG